MSQEWLNIQSFFTDHDLIRAINDLSIAVKLELAGVEDQERARRAGEARKVLRGFLGQLAELEGGDGREVLLGIDARFQSLTDALASARQDTARFNSVLMREGAAVALPLLEAGDTESKAKLLDSLSELRRVVEQHQQADATVIFEEQ
jgi:uncharacterized membrane protein YccC